MVISFIIYAAPEIQIQLCDEIIHDLEVDRDGIVDNLFNGTATNQNLYSIDQQIVDQVYKQKYWEEIQEKTFFWK